MMPQTRQNRCLATPVLKVYSLSESCPCNKVKREAVRDADVWEFRHTILSAGGRGGGRAYSERRPHLAILLKNGKYVVADRLVGDMVERAKGFAVEMKPPREIRRIRDADCTVERHALWAVTLLRIFLPAGMAALMWLRWSML